MLNNIIIVATSNRHPDDLYKNGLQRDRFLPFIEMFKQKMNIFKIESDTDYRMKHLKSLKQLYFFPLGAESENFINNAFQECAGDKFFNNIIIEVKGRKILVEKASSNVALFSFKSLCEANLGSEDYIEISRRFSTIILYNIPKLLKQDYNLAIRFTKLIDELYEHKCKLICSAEVPANLIYEEGEQAFEFQRTISRLIEMQSEDYMGLEHLA
jgi:cell division protein ZapE